MDTVENAIQYLQLHETPYWWVKSGKTKIGEYVASEDMNTSIAHFRTASALWPAGTYTLECSYKEQNRSSSFSFPFTKGQQPAATAQAMGHAQGVSTNAYGISDQLLKQIQEEARFKMLVEGMADDFKDFMKEWPEYKKKIDKIDAFLKDEDENGTPDILENVKKGTEMVKTVSELGSVFKNVGKLNL